MPSNLTDRADVQMAAVVDLAVELSTAQGQRVAAMFLEASGAKFALIPRVLAEPARRRTPLPPNVLPLPRVKR